MVLGIGVLVLLDNVPEAYILAPDRLDILPQVYILGPDRQVDIEALVVVDIVVLVSLDNVLQEPDRQALVVLDNWVLVLLDIVPQGPDRQVDGDDGDVG